MKADVLSLEGKKLKSIDLPSQFEEEYRPNLIKRAVLAIFSHRRQKYGANPEAGKRSSSKISRRRKKYRGAYGHGISRVPRKILSRSGVQFNWVGAFAPGTVGGRRAHPPKAEKNWGQKINVKERRKAIRSAISAVFYNSKSLIIEPKLESVEKTKNVEKFLKTLGLENEIKRLKEKKVRAGKGKMRGRKYRRKKGPLFVVSKKCPLMKSAFNINGTDIAVVDSLNAELLAPGADTRRITIWSQSAIERLAKEKLFLETKK
ncbi:MAG: 50S ribosomal protein L4 [Nanoarchaeota archaeon]|nr:50S ribosomal protein L4 [Nanoarchaeota archaeon]